MDQQELYTYGISFLKEKRPNLDTSEGSISYDLLTPLSYIGAELSNHLDDVKNELNPIYAKEQMLTYWAEPRIGKRKEAIKTKIKVEGENLNYRTWFFKEVTFKKLDSSDIETATFEAENIGKVDIHVNDTLNAESDNTVTAKVIEIIDVGADEENIEVYRQRYINSLLVDSQIGLGTTYSSKIQEHEDVSVAIVDYPQSTNGQVNVYLLNSNYEYVTNIEEISTYFTTTNPIVPFGQTLVLQSLEKQTISVTVNYDGRGLTEGILLQYLQNLNKSYYIPNLAKTQDVRYTIRNVILRNKMISDLTEYGNIESIVLKVLNTALEEILLDHQYPDWEIESISLKVTPS